MRPPTTMVELRRELEFDPEVASLDLPSLQEEEKLIKELEMGTALSKPTAAASAKKEEQEVKENLKMGATLSRLSPVATFEVAERDHHSMNIPKAPSNPGVSKRVEQDEEQDVKDIPAPAVKESKQDPIHDSSMKEPTELGAFEGETELPQTKELTMGKALVGLPNTNQAKGSDLDTPLARFLNDPAEAVDRVPVESVLSDHVGSEPVTDRLSPLPPETPTRPRAMYSSPTNAVIPSRSSQGTNNHARTYERRERSISPIHAAKRRATVAHRSQHERRPTVSPCRRSGGRDGYRSAPAFQSQSQPPVRELFPLHVARSHEREPALSSRYETPIKSRSRSSTISPEKRPDIKEDYGMNDGNKKKYPSLKSIDIPGMGEEDKLVCYNCGKKGHWFMDCMVGCGRCGGDGHRTIDCDILGKGKLIKREDIDGQ